MVIIDIPLRRCEQYMTDRRNMEQLNLIYGYEILLHNKQNKS